MIGTYLPLIFLYFTGLMKDINGTYNYAFYAGGIAAVVGAFILLIATKVDQKQKQKSSTMKYIVETHF
jgi:bacteriorhodopsin